MGAHSRVTRRTVARRTTTVRSVRRLVGSGVLGVAAMSSVVGGTGVAQAEQAVPSGCDVYLSAGLASIAPNSEQTRACLAGSESPSSDTSSSSSGSSSTTTTTTTPSTPTSTTSTTTSTAQPVVMTSEGTPSTDPADEPAAPGETKSVPIG